MPNLDTDPDEHTYMHRSLCDLNTDALRFFAKSDFAEAVTTYGKLFRKVKQQNLTHAELYTCYSNSAATLLQLQQYDAALQHADHARKLAELALKRQEWFVHNVLHFCQHVKELQYNKGWQA